MPSASRPRRPVPRFVASLTQSLSATGRGELQLFPAGAFRAQDGRPAECDAWHLDAKSAARLVNQVAGRATPFVIDYEHQSLTAATSGHPAPAAGWFSRVEWREGLGLFAVDVTWTARAAAHIDADEYKFISPVFAYDKAGIPTQIINAALTNNPALDGMDEVRLAALTLVQTQESSMEELLEQLRWLLNLPVGATAADVQAQLQKLIDQLSGGAGTAAASVDLAQILAERDSRIAALTATQADPSKFVSIDVVQAMQAEIAALTNKATGDEVEQLVTAALADGRLHDSMANWARDLGKADIAKLRAYVSAAPKIAALTSTQTRGQPPVPPAGGALDQDTLAVCRLMGNDPAAVKQTLGL